jgi:hypothetical protein
MYFIIQFEERFKVTGFRLFPIDIPFFMHAVDAILWLQKSLPEFCETRIANDNRVLNLTSNNHGDIKCCVLKIRSEEQHLFSTTTLLLKFHGSKK